MSKPLYHCAMNIFNDLFGCLPALTELRKTVSIVWGIQISVVTCDQACQCTRQYSNLTRKWLIALVPLGFFKYKLASLRCPLQRKICLTIWTKKYQVWFPFFFCILKLQPPFVFLSLGLFSLVNGYFINVAVVKWIVFRQPKVFSSFNDKNYIKNMMHLCKVDSFCSSSTLLLFDHPISIVGGLNKNNNLFGPDFKHHVRCFMAYT